MAGIGAAILGHELEIIGRECEFVGLSYQGTIQPAWTTLFPWIWNEKEIYFYLPSWHKELLKRWMLWWRFLYKCQCQQRREAPWGAWLDPLTSRETSVNNFCLQTGAPLFMFRLSEINWMCSAREIEGQADFYLRVPPMPVDSGERVWVWRPHPEHLLPHHAQ